MPLSHSVERGDFPVNRCCSPIKHHGFTIVEMLTTVAVLIILMGLMVSLARHVRASSSDHLTRDILRELDEAMLNYTAKYGAPPPVADFISGGPLPSEHVLQTAAERNCESFVRPLKFSGLLSAQFQDLSVAYFDEVRVRDAWGSAIVFMPKMHPAIGMNTRGWFFFSAGPDRQYLTRDDNLYSYDQPTRQQ